MSRILFNEYKSHAWYKTQYESDAFLCYSLGLNVTHHKLNSVDHSFQGIYRLFLTRPTEVAADRKQQRKMLLLYGNAQI